MIRRLTSAFLLLLLIAGILPVQAAMPVATENDLVPFTGVIPAGIQNSPAGVSQSVLEFFAPFLAVFVLGFVLILRREQRKGMKHPLLFWFAMCSGLFYLGSSAIVFVQMIRLVQIVGLSPFVPVALVYVMVPAILGIWAMRLARTARPRDIQTRVLLALIGIIGILFWTGLVIGPLMSLGAAIIPERWGEHGTLQIHG